MREAKRLALPTEPHDSDKESVKLTVRLADGTRVSRRFHMRDTIQTVLDFVDVSQEQPADNCLLVSNFPKYVNSRSSTYVLHWGYPLHGKLKFRPDRLNLPYKKDVCTTAISRSSGPKLD